MEYRREIDGLRAVAVIIVLLFHAGITQGGYIGVDVFFLISGYLITNLILINIKSNSFSISYFYEKRIRRILPALFFVILIYSPFAFYEMTSDQLKNFGQSIIAALLFISNILFLATDEYFAISSDYIPLLHTWSLSVEAQFYLLYPVFLLLMWRLAKQYLVIAIITLIIISLILAELMSNRYPMANFYLPFSRIWELMLGALIAYVESSNGRSNNRILTMIMPSLGLIAIILSALLFHDEISHPSIITTIPIIGAAMIVWFGGKNDLCSNILASKPFVAIGLLSYSIYLWHQPILVYLRLNNAGQLSYIAKYTFLPMTVFVSYISWKYIEQPFHDAKITSRKFIFYSLTIMGATLLAIGLIFYNRMLVKTESFDSVAVSLKREAIHQDCTYKHTTAEDEKWFCKLSDSNQTPSFALIGDSHAEALINTVEKIAIANNIHGIATTLRACTPLLYYNMPNYAECKLMNEKMFGYINKHQIKTVLIVAKWVGYHRDSLSSLVKTIQAYNDIGVHVIIMQQVPKQEKDPMIIYKKIFSKPLDEKEKYLRKSSVSRNKYLNKQKVFTEKLNNLNKSHLTILDFTDQFCDHEVCLIGTLDKSYYFDDNHLSQYGTALLAEKLSLVLASQQKR